MEGKRDYILGLDLGVASVGWAVVWCDGHGEPTGIAETRMDPDGREERGLGARIFDAGVDSGKMTLESAMGKGEDKSNALARRMARGMRRQHFRQSQRRGRQFRALVAVGLLPAAKDDSRLARHEALLQLDGTLRAKWCASGDMRDQQTWTYRLRGAAVEGPLDAFEVGRALYQLGHRRGFRSNRKTDPRAAEGEVGENDSAKKKRGKKGEAGVQHAVKTERPGQSGAEPDEASRQKEDEKRRELLRAELKQSGKTLGAFMAVFPAERRIRGEEWRCTDRQMYLDEFKAIIKTQGEYHACLRERETVNALYKAIFGQRGLKSSRRLIGKCLLEPGKLRALRALPIAQEFRMLQKVNDLEVIAPDVKTRRLLNEEERRRILAAMGEQANISFNGLRKLLDESPPGNKWEKGDWDEQGLWVANKKGKKARLVERGWTFNFEPQTDDGGKEELPGDRTMAKLRPIFPHWDNLPADVKDEIVFMLEAAERPETIEKVALAKREAWGLDEAGIQKLREVHLESGRAGFSRLALEKMVEKMKEKVVVEGVERYRRYQEARRAAYPKMEQAPVEDFLPPVLLSARHPKNWDAPGKDGKPNRERMMDPRIAVKNPAVIRVLTEMRKVVNAVIRRYGRPRMIRIESGKELAKGRKDREEIWKKNLKRRAEVDGIVRAAGGDPTNQSQREKILLADECGWVCPYSGENITPHKLYALDEFAVEHIIPLSRSRDNTMRNKTLCRHKENGEKNNRTTWEAFHGDGRWHNMVEWVRRFRGAGAKEKLRRFTMTPEEVEKEFGENSFTRRHLQDTQFAAKAARRYLSLLFGDRNDDGYSPRVQAVSGGMTGHLRRAWELEGVIPGLSNLPRIPAGMKDGEKYRFDHRHHALDAAVVAMTTPREIKRMADETRLMEGRRSFTDPARFAKVNPPLANLATTLKRQLEGVIVSHREDRKVGGGLHDGTLYPKQPTNGNRGQRKELKKCTAKDIENIVDGRIREIVQKKLVELGGDIKAFGMAVNYPYLMTKKGRQVPIHKVRVKVRNVARAIGRLRAGVDERFVDYRNNHHIVIVRVPGKGPAMKWKCKCASRFEVHRRWAEWRKEWDAKKEPERSRLVESRWPVGVVPELVLHKGDTLVLDDQWGNPWIVQKMSEGNNGEGDITLRPHNDARKAGDIASEFRYHPVENLRKRGPKKVTITPLGEVVDVGHGTHP